MSLWWEENDRRLGPRKPLPRPSCQRYKCVLLRSNERKTSFAEQRHSEPG